MATDTLLKEALRRIESLEAEVSEAYQCVASLEDDLASVTIERDSAILQLQRLIVDRRYEAA